MTLFGKPEVESEIPRVKERLEQWLKETIT